MSLVDKQFQFVLDVLELLNYSIQCGLTITLGEVYRTPEQQEIYFKSGRSKTMKSQHLNRLAIDLNFFRDGKMITNREQIKPIGDFWERLRIENRWGGSWRGKVERGESNFIDAPHFETL